MWKEIIINFALKNRYIAIQPPARDSEIAELVNILGEIPLQLQEFLRETNGDGFLMMPTKQIIETNISLRELPTFMPLDCLLFFAANGCGDYFGFPISKDGIKQDNIFRWDHESDNRIWVAGNIKDLINRYYKDEIC